MTANTSASGGYLAPSSTAPLYDGSFDQFLQAVIVGITGLTGPLVRPRWQETPPVQPARSTDWCAFGVYEIEAGDNADIRHISTSDGSSQLVRMEKVKILVSMYGPDAMALGARFRDGLWISQNREVMILAGVTLHDVGVLISAPELVNDKWLNRADLEIHLSRSVGRVYPILNLLSAEGTIVADLQTVYGGGVDTMPWETPQPVTP